MAQKLIGFGNFWAAWIAPEWFAVEDEFDLDV